MTVEKGNRSGDSRESFAAGRYQVIRLLGEGAQKTVYLVRDTTLGRDCALSLLKTDAVDSDDLGHARNEAEAMARLGTQPHTVTIFDVGEDEDDRPYLISEYVPGGDLRQELSQAAGLLPLRRTFAIAKDLCRALATVHQQGIVHRDLKPSNVWLTGRGTAKLGDFGIARVVDRARLTTTGTLIGTAAYASPEQAQGHEVTARSDLYSLGCVLYEMLTGQPPFVADDPLTVVSQHVHAEPDPPSEHNAAMPRALEQLILRLLAKEPAARPASAEEVLAELEAIEPPAPVAKPMRRHSIGPRWKKPARRALVSSLMLAILAGGAAVALVMIGLGGGAGGDDAYTQIRYHFSSADVPPGETSGDCQTTDLILGSADPGSEYLSGPVTGDFNGQQFVTAIQTTLFAQDGCQSGFFTMTAILISEDGDELHITDGAPISLTVSSDLGTYSLESSGVETVTGGTGIYEGATGGGTCSWVTVGRGDVGPQGEPLGPTSATTESDCTLRVSTDQAFRAETPLIVGLAPSTTEAAIFGSSADLPTAVEVLVAYWNGGSEPLTGLSIRLTPPEDTELLTAARVDGEQPSTGARVWALPDLPPGGEVRRFQFQLQFLSVERRAVPLVVEIDGDGFDEPVASEPVIISVGR